MRRPARLHYLPLRLPLSARLLLVFLWAALPQGYAQPHDTDLKTFLFEVEHEYGISILYKSELVQGIRLPADLPSLATGDFSTYLNTLLAPHDLLLKRIDERSYVILSTYTAAPIPPIDGNIMGQILDEHGAPMQGVNLTLKGTTLGTSTNAQGQYLLSGIPAGQYELEASFMGYIKRDTSFQVTRTRRNHRFHYQMRPDLLSLQTVVITGVNQPVVNIASGVAVTSINQEDIGQISPRSTADAFQNIPGFYVESSAGEVSNNLFSRGIPSEGFYQYVALHEDGLPIYEAGNIDWVAADHFFRIDGTTKHIEAMRGGSAGVFAGNAPSGIINFVSQTGGSKRAGQLKIQTADYGQLRIDAHIGGPLLREDNTWRYHIGGFYRVDNGIRSPGFLANNGGQVKGNITKIFNNGLVRISAKYLNDRNIYYLPIPLQNTTKPRGIEQFDPNYGTLASANIRRVRFPTPNGRKPFDLADGMHTHLGYLGSHATFELGDGWQLTNKNRFSIIQKNSHAIVSLFTPRSIDRLIEKYRIFSRSFTPYVTYTQTGLPFDPYTQNDNGLVVEAGWWANQNTLRNFINSLEIKKETKQFQLSGNFYFSSFSNLTSRDWGSTLLEVTSNQPRALNLEALNPDSTLAYQLTDQGFTTYQSLDTYLNSKGNAWVVAGFTHGKYFFTPNTAIDAGFRYEQLYANGVIENTQLYNLNPYDVTNFVLESVRYGDSTFQAYDVSKADIAWSIGFQHLFTPLSSAYIRVSDGFRMPDFDNWQNGQYNGGLIERIFQSELGYKYASDRYAFLFSGFYSYISNQVTTQATIDDEGNLIPPLTRNALSYGGEFEVAAELWGGLSVKATATLQKATYDINPSQEFIPGYEVNGNDVKRIPNVFFVLQPAYDYKGFQLFGTAQYIGQRFSNEINTDILPAFASFNLGCSYKYKSYTLLLHAQNLTNSIGLTEGNPRVITDVSQEPYRMARPILGRSVIGSVAYQF